MYTCDARQVTRRLDALLGRRPPRDRAIDALISAGDSDIKTAAELAHPGIAAWPRGRA
jgi:hypothetical protein